MDLTIVTLIAVFLTAGETRAQGTLDQMREDLKNKPQSDKPTDENRTTKPSTAQDQHRDDVDDGAAEGALASWLLFAAVGAGIDVSIARASKDAQRSSALGVKSRVAGDALLPHARVDSAVAWVDSDIYAVTVTGETGWGPAALLLNYVGLFEDDSDDRLDVFGALGALRLSAGSHFEVDLALGLGAVGNTAGVAFSLPIRVHPSTFWGLEFRPRWTAINSQVFEDYRGVVLFGTRHISVQAGIQVYRTASIDLFGPVVGFALRY